MLARIVVPLMTGGILARYTAALRGDVLKKMYDDEHVIALGCACPQC